jgi:hypothetical protein
MLRFRMLPKISATLLLILGLTVGCTSEDNLPVTSCPNFHRPGSIPEDAKLEISNDNLEFGNHDVGTVSASQSAVLCNTGRQALQITQEPGAPDDFIVESGCARTNLAPGQGCTILVSFRPTASSQSNQVTLKFTGTAANNAKTATPVELDLFGKAFLAVTGEPNYLIFPPQVVGTTSSVRSIKVTNETGSSVSFSNLYVSPDFTIVDRTACPERLDKHKSCNINIGFSPHATGEISGVVSISYVELGADSSAPTDSTASSKSTNLTGSSAPADPTASSASTIQNVSKNPLTVSVRGIGVGEPRWVARFGSPRKALSWSLLVTLLYLAGIIITRWNMIAKPNRNLCSSQIRIVQSRLDAEPGFKEKNPNLQQLLTEAAGSIATFNIFDLSFWTRGQEGAAWRRVHEVELQLIRVTPPALARASLEVAEQDLHHLSTPSAVALADRIHETLQSVAAEWTSLLTRLSVLSGSDAVDLGTLITRESNRDLLRVVAKFLQPEAAVASQIEQVLGGTQTPDLQNLANDILGFLPQSELTQTKQSLEPCPSGFPSEWEDARQATVGFLVKAIDVVTKVQAVSATDPTLAQSHPIVIELKDLLATQSSVADKVNPILSDKTANSWPSLLQKTKDFFARLVSCGTDVKQMPLEYWKSVLDEFIPVVSGAAAFCYKINTSDPANLSVSDVKDIGVFLLQPRDALVASIKQLQASREASLDRWRALLLEATQIIYEYRDTKYDTLASWQNKAIWLIGCGILFIVALAAIIPNAIFFLVGAAGGYLSRLSRELKRDDVPSDYGASWSTVFLSPVVGALTGWAGLLLAIMLARLGILGNALELDWNNPYEPVALGIAFMLGFSERLFDTILSSLEGGVFKQTTKSATTSLTITTAPTLPAGKIGQDYKALNVTLSASGGTPGYTWSVSPGSSLPKDLVLDTNGVIHGAPGAKTDVPAKMTIQVTDKDNNKATKEFNITINP